ARQLAAKIWKGTLFLTALSSVMFALGASVLYAQSQSMPQSELGSPTSPAPIVSIEQDRLTLKITFDNGAVFEVSQFEGKTTRIKVRGEVYAIACYKRVDHLVARIFRPVIVRSHRGEILAETTEELGIVEVRGADTPINVGSLNIRVEVVDAHDGSSKSGNDS